MCMDQGGILAYQGFNSSVDYATLQESLVARYKYTELWFGATRRTTGDIVGLNRATFSWSTFAASEPSLMNSSQTCMKICSADGKWCNGNCLDTLPAAVCQKPKGESLLSKMMTFDAFNYCCDVLVKHFLLADVFCPRFCKLFSLFKHQPTSFISKLKNQSLLLIRKNCKFLSL